MTEKFSLRDELFNPKKVTYLAALIKSVANQGQIFCASHQGIPQPVFALNLNNYQEST
jgi:hypothetical protein